MKISFLPSAATDLAGLSRRLGDHPPAWRKNVRQIYRAAREALDGPARTPTVAGPGDVYRYAIPGTFVIVYYRIQNEEIRVLRVWDAMAGHEDPAVAGVPDDRI